MPVSRKGVAAISLGLVLLVHAASAPAAWADTVQSTVSGGDLTVSTSGATLGGVTLNGTTQTASGSSSSAWTVTDARGTGVAWAVSVTATTPTSAAGSADTTARTIAVGNLKVTTGTVTAGTDSDATTNISGSTALALSTSAQTLLSSSGGNKGTYSLTPSYTLAVPANAYRSNYSGAVGSSALNPYSSTLTYTIA